MAIKALTAEHAVIHTAAVEVKTLTISGKQVTLSVFRQLPENALIIDADDRPVFAGVPWGRVNYYWEKQSREALHVVWQHGDALFRDLVPTHSRGANADWRYSVEEDVGDWFVHAVAEGHIKSETASSMLRRKRIDGDLWTCLSGHLFGRYWHDIAITPELEPHYTGIVASAIRLCGAQPVGADERAAIIRAEVGKLDMWESSYLQLIDQLKALDQLFIAV